MNEPVCILVCDDSKVSRIMSIGLLRKRLPGCRIVEAADAEQAMALVQTEPVQLLLLDHNMPGRTGLELAEELRQRHPALHIALLTANVQDATQLRAASLGVPFYRKPVNGAVVADILSHFALDRAGAPA